jgi:CRISPR-associated protein Cmr1
MRIPKIAPAGREAKSLEDRGLVEIVREFEVVTPIFGGGVHVDDREDQRHVKKIDEITPVRPAAVRGQLRFWWRLCTELEGEARRNREMEIWGEASKPGLTSLTIEAPAGVVPKAVQVFKWEERNGKWNRIATGGRGVAYGAFSLQGGAKLPPRSPLGTLWEVKGIFRLRAVTSRDFKSQVEAAIDAWLAFGGVGGRTRRGFGAIARTDRKDRDIVPPAFEDCKWSSKTPGMKTASDALEYGLKLLKAFRQGVGFARNPGRKDKPGRSLWPEADTLRHKVTGQMHDDHKARTTRVDGFPRARFGMPIIFQFPGTGDMKKTGRRNLDPQPTTLVPVLRGKVMERLASPVFIRPIRLPPQPNGEPNWQVAVLVLRSGYDPKLAVRIKEFPGVRSEDIPVRVADSADQIKPLAACAEKNALDALLEVVRKPSLLQDPDLLNGAKP